VDPAGPAPTIAILAMAKHLSTRTPRFQAARRGSES
jgi:hypothetical protein